MFSRANTIGAEAPVGGGLFAKAAVSNGGGGLFGAKTDGASAPANGGLFGAKPAAATEG